MPQIDIDILIEDTRWQSLDLDGLAETALQALAEVLGIDAEGLELSLLAADDSRIAALNADFRGKPQPTNVLSWPAVDVHPPDLPDPDPGGTIALGDVALAYETCAREAQDQRKSVHDHVTHLFVHGVLHLLGHDHVKDTDAANMERLEIEILGKLGLGDPYS